MSAGDDARNQRGHRNIHELIGHENCNEESGRIRRQSFDDSKSRTGGLLKGSQLKSRKAEEGDLRCREVRGKQYEKRKNSEFEECHGGILRIPPFFDIRKPCVLCGFIERIASVGMMTLLCWLF